MPELRLPRLPDRTPTKVGIQIPPQLHADLALYARLYKETYAQEETVTDLIPSMLAAFLEMIEPSFVRDQANDHHDFEAKAGIERADRTDQCPYPGRRCDDGFQPIAHLRADRGRRNPNRQGSTQHLDLGD